MRPVPRTLLDTEEPPTPAELDVWREQHAEAWIERTLAGMTRQQKTRMALKLKLKRGGQKKWTPEEEAVLLEIDRQMKLAGLSPMAIHKQLGEDYGVSPRTIANKLSELRGQSHRARKKSLSPRPA